MTQAALLLRSAGVKITKFPNAWDKENALLKRAFEMNLGLSLRKYL